MLDCKIERLPDCYIARLLDCEIDRLLDYKSVRLLDCKTRMAALLHHTATAAGWCWQGSGDPLKCYQCGERDKLSLFVIYQHQSFTFISLNQIKCHRQTVTICHLSPELCFYQGRLHEASFEDWIKIIQHKICDLSLLLQSGDYLPVKD